MPDYEAGELRRWRAEDYPEGSPGRRGDCRFAPNCSRYQTCPGAPAEFSQRMGGIELGGYERFIPLCRNKAVDRFGSLDVERCEAGA